MRIGIVTFFDHSNYGAVLQAYALQEAIRECGNEAYHIAFDDEAENSVGNGQAIPPFLAKIREQSERRDALFCEFREKYLNVRRIGSKTIEGTDLFIVGSDQVWNPAITRADDRYFLAFADESKRASYAASFGQQLPPEMSERYARGLSAFRSLSVREFTAAMTVERLIGKTAEVNCDPVFLLDSKKWMDLIDDTENDNADYNLLIMVQNDMKLYNSCKAEAEREGTALRVITASYCPPLGFEPWSGISVPQWLSLIFHARKVITSSFHGLAFSLIFEKPFEIAINREGLEARNGRLEDLLGRIGLSDVGSIMTGKSSKSDDLPDHEKIRRVLAEDKCKGYQYLKRLFEYGERE